ncbi:MAG: hypothetical protein FWB91_00375 [Defluviitaleaceae bacterium]|nr:hypothetical protein [Defluviitaleaceae bacterium]
MATSTFYEKITIDNDAAKILVDGLNGPKHPRPVVPEGMKWKEDDELSRLFREGLQKLAQAQSK